MTTLREFFSLPMTAGNRDRQVAVDELGRPVYETPRGEQYTVREEQPQSFGDGLRELADDRETELNALRAYLERVQ